MFFLFVKIIFLVDCSETMNDHNSIDLVCQVLNHFLEILPVNCQFNIIRFSSTFYSLLDKTMTDAKSKNK